MPMREPLWQPCLRLSRLTAQFLVVTVVLCATLPASGHNPTVDCCADANSCAYLGQNHSTPSNPSTTVPLAVALEDSKVQLVVANAAGSCSWNSGDDRDGVSSSVNFYMIDAGNDRRTRKMVLLQ
jgi:hypothetical protein